MLRKTVITISILNIVESRKTDQGFKRSSIVIFRDDIDDFMEAYEVSADLFRGRRGQSEKVLSVGEGRRSYTFRIVERRNRTFEIIELREDATGRRRESIQLQPDAIDLFEEGFDKAVSVMKNPE